MRLLAVVVVYEIIIISFIHFSILNAFWCLILSEKKLSATLHKQVEIYHSSVYFCSSRQFTLETCLFVLLDIGCFPQSHTPRCRNRSTSHCKNHCCFVAFLLFSVFILFSVREGHFFAKYRVGSLF